MGPLVYYCRWRGARLRLRGRNAESVWGQLVTAENGVERAETFRFDLLSWQLWLGENGERQLQLDEMGVVIGEIPPAGS